MDQPRSLPQLFNEMKESIALLKQCPVCNDTYKEETIQTIEQTAHSTLMHITCAACGHGLVALMGNTAMGMGLVALVTDLSRTDVVRFKSNEPMSDDELLEHYDMIHNSRLLAKQLT